MNLISEREEDCACVHGCGTSAIIQEYECGCVKVRILNDQTAGRDCTDFSGMRETCSDH